MDTERKEITKDEENLHWNNSFVNQTRLPLLCEKSGAILVVLVGLTAGWQASSQTK